MSTPVSKSRTWIAIIELAIIGLHSIEEKNPKAFAELTDMESKLIRMKMKLEMEEEN